MAASTEERTEHYHVCDECGKEFRLIYSDADYRRWKSGKLIQKVMPYLNDDDRELLVSGICENDWREMFGEEEDD